MPCSGKNALILLCLFLSSLLAALKVWELARQYANVRADVMPPLQNGILGTVNPGELLVSGGESVLSIMARSGTRVCLVSSEALSPADRSHACPRDPEAAQIQVCLRGPCDDDSSAVRFGGMQGLVTLALSLRTRNSVLLDRQGRILPPR